MEYLVKSGQAEKQRTAAIVVGVFKGRKLSNAAQAIDNASNGHISKILKRGDLEGNFGQFLTLFDIDGTLSERIILVGLGKEKEFNINKYKKIIHKTVKKLHDSGSMDAVICLTQLTLRSKTIYDKVRLGVETAELACYRFETYKSHSNAIRRPLKKITFMTHSRVETSEAERAINDAYGIAIGQKKAMDLKNTPANDCNPEYLRDQALDLGKNNAKVKTTCLTEKEMHKLGMHCLLSVGRGSAYGSYLVTIEYKGGAKDESPIAFVGKGVTFDAGGIDLKPAKGMAAMKMDMGGAAGVLGTMESIIELDLPINVIGVVAIVENVIGSNAYRPSDVLTSMSGQTVEVLNTDAEGRLILCDALTYVEKFNPRTVIDLATLTGAIIVSLGPEYTGLFGNHNPLINELLTASQSSTDYSWHLPMPENYNEYLESEVADMTNVGSTNAAGSILAAMFLSKFTKKYKWAHLDVAASAMGGLEKPKATGRPVPMLVQYVLNQLDHSKTG